MGKRILLTAFLVLILSLWVTPGHITAMGDDPCVEMGFTLNVHNQTAHTIEVMSQAYDMCNNRGGAVQTLKTIPKGSTEQIKWAGRFYKFDKKTYVKFDTKRLIDAGRLQITNHINKRYSGADLKKSHDVYLNQNLVIMAF